MSRHKTKEEKIKSAYRLQNFRLQVEERVAVKDASEFGYLASNYIVRDLSKTLVYTAIVLALLMLAKKYLGA